ncbi:thyroglobulin type-1 repeat-containing domain protein [Cooperia oncophora]
MMSNARMWKNAARTHADQYVLTQRRRQDCIHLVVAVKKLPNQSLHNEYVPKCDENGKFMPIQCDQRQCWCVDVNYGTEIAGSAVTVAMKRGDMCRERNWFFYGKIDQLKPT